MGATGAGKSSTVNAVFGASIAKVGEGVSPETQVISDYRCHEYFRIHDSAGLGDGRESDLSHATNITKRLLKQCTVNGEVYGLIDIALVILDASSRDLGTAFKLLETVILRSIAPERVIIAINQADMAMKGRYWNVFHSRPEAPLENFLAEQALSVQRRIRESTGCHVKLPVSYSAKHNYNTEKLLQHIISCMPASRRRLKSATVT